MVRSSREMELGSLARAAGFHFGCRGRARPLTFRVAAVVAGAIVATGLGCAASMPIVTNVVRDADVQGCSLEVLDQLVGLDVAIVIDTSLSTRRPSGIDVDGDGRISKFRRNPTFDRGDSRLAATIDGLRPLMRNAAEHDVRFSVVTFAGPNVSPILAENSLANTRSDSKVYSQLTTNTQQLDRALTEVLNRGSTGTSVFYAGMRRGFHTLTRETSEGRRRMVLLLSDGPRPTGNDPSGVDASGGLIFRDPRLKSAALMARERQVVFHTFGLSRESNSWRYQPLGRIAGATGGDYHAVEDPHLFYCHLAQALAPPSSESDWERMFARVKRAKAASESR